MRCAIYTRKSSTEGLEQPFNSLDAQRLACSHFIASQAAEGWVELDTRYDDGGFSGGSLVRPALGALLRDVENGAIDIIVVYKIDRLSRSLRDFVHLVDRFERQAVTFASVTQQFSTTSSMGRLTLNVLLSFAQFERDLTSERIRDKFAAVRSKGMRPQGGRPFGYRFVARILEIDRAEAAIVNRIFRTFIKLGTATPIPETLNRAGLVNHRGMPFTLPFVRRLLRNRLYRGDLVHRGQATAGVHPPIVSERTWNQAQAIMAPHITRWAGRNTLGRGMLTGLLFGPMGPLLHEAGISSNKVYRYCGPAYRLRKGLPRFANGRFRAESLEQVVLDVLDPDHSLARGADPESAACELVRSLVDRVDIGDEITIRLKTGSTLSIDRAPWLKTSRLQRRVLTLATRETGRPPSHARPSRRPAASSKSE